MINQMSPALRKRQQARSVVRSESGAYLVWGKSMFDILIASLVTVGVLIWLIPLVGTAIMIESRGPALFVQRRTGVNGKPFLCLKFRTMKYVRNAEFQQATQRDMRVTRIGRFLRKTNLDEMPQFINVLAGHMSVIGPRPHPVPLDEKYWEVMPGYKDRYGVRPGITGLAQSRGARGETRNDLRMKLRVRYDLLYIRRQSLALDLKICYWTVRAMFTGNKNAW